jgi:hypothetical protein
MRLAQRLSRVASTVLGVFLALTPAALWVAWNASLLLAVMAAAVVAAGLLVLLTESSPQQQADGGKVELPPEFIDEVHQLFPLTYHHSARGPSRFRRAMQRLSQELPKAR